MNLTDEQLSRVQKGLSMIRGCSGNNGAIWGLKIIDDVLVGHPHVCPQCNGTKEVTGICSITGQPFEEACHLCKSEGTEREPSSSHMVKEKQSPDNKNYATEREIERARCEICLGSNNNIEVESNALVSRSDEGVWVQAWVWLVGD